MEGVASKSGGQAKAETSKYVINLEVDYANDDGGIPVPQEVRYGGRTGIRCRFDQVKLGVTTPESAFTVGGYDLPDPTTPVRDPARSTVPYWLIGAAVLAIICVVILRRKGAG